MTYAMNIPAIRSDWVGRVIDGRFTLVEWLGGSESAGVFLTELRGLPWQKAAIKLILADSREAETRIAAWEVTRKLSHPHLLSLIATGRCRMDDVALVYAVTEYTEEMLSQILPERPLTPAESAEMLAPVVDALTYLHSNGVVHGHLKPSNIMVVDDAVKISSDSLHLAGERRKGAVALSVYDAPEIADGPISAAADVWSLGVTLVEALTQKPPVLGRYSQHDPNVPPSVPPPFAAIAEDCLRFDPARRCRLSDVKARLQGDSPASEEAIQRLPAKPVPGEVTDSLSAAHRGAMIFALTFVLAASAVTIVVRLRHAEPGLPTASQPSLNMPAPASGSQIAPTAAEPSPEAVAAPVPATSREGSLKGEVAERVQPDVLPSARDSIRGQVNLTVRVAVDANGNVSNVSLDSPGPSKYFAKQALEAGQRWKFKPAQVDGRSVASVWSLQFRFTQAATEVTPIEVSP